GGLNLGAGGGGCKSGEDVGNQGFERGEIAGEARNDGGERALGVEGVVVERPAGVSTEELQEDELCTAVAFAEGMPGIKFGEEVGRGFGEGELVQIGE